MAHVYVRSGAGGAGTGADWTNAYTTLAAALTAKSAGDNFWVSEDHAETAAAVKTHTSPGTATAPCTIICVNHAGTVPPVSADLRTTATVSTTGANDMNFFGYVFCYGVTFSAGSSTNAASLNFGLSAVTHWILDSCSLVINNSNNSSIIGFGANGNHQYYDLYNTPCTFGAVNQGIWTATSKFRWRSTASAIGGIVPTVLFHPDYDRSNVLVELEGLDLSVAGAGKTIFGAADHPTKYKMKDCKLGSGVTIAASPTTGMGVDIESTRSDSAGNYRHEKYNFGGTQITETTIVRTGGASDGVTPIAWRIDTTANAKWINPFESFPIGIWNDIPSVNKTITVFGVWGGGAVPNNDDIWIEISYLGASGNPLATMNRSNTKANYLAAAAGQTSDTSTWGGSTTKFKMVVTLSSPQPAQKGMIYVTIKAGKASSTFYIDPKVVVS